MLLQACLPERRMYLKIEQDISTMSLIVRVKIFKSFLLLTSASALLSFAAGADSIIVTKAEWNGAEPKRELEKLQLPVPKVVIAHTAGRACSDKNACIQQVHSIQNYHMDSNYDDIAYNFLVGNDGHIYEGRGWELVGAGVLNHNREALSIAFIGNFDKDTPTEEALNATKSLLEMGVRTGKLAEDYKLYGHRQLVATTSPGAALYSNIKQWSHWSRL